MVRQTLRGLVREDNLVLQHVTSAVFLALYQPLLQQIIAQGKAEGVFDVEEPADMAELILLLSAALRSSVEKQLNA